MFKSDTAITHSFDYFFKKTNKALDVFKTAVACQCYSTLFLFSLDYPEEKAHLYEVSFIDDEDNNFYRGYVYSVRDNEHGILESILSSVTNDVLTSTQHRKYSISICRVKMTSEITKTPRALADLASSLKGDPIKNDILIVEALQGDFLALQKLLIKSSQDRPHLCFSRKIP